MHNYFLEWLFFHINLRSIHHNDKAKTELSQLHQLIKNKKTEISTLHLHTLNSVLSWSTFTASSLFGYDVTSFAYQNLAILPSSPHLFTSQAVRLEWGRRAFSGFYRNIWLSFNTRLWLDTQEHSQSCL